MSSNRISLLLCEEPTHGILFHRLRLPPPIHKAEKTLLLNPLLLLPRLLLRLALRSDRVPFILHALYAFLSVSNVGMNQTELRVVLASAVDGHGFATLGTIKRGYWISVVAYFSRPKWGSFFNQ